jgi:hypothetical protein
MQKDPRTLFQHGIDLFNRREFFECHEYLEEVWTPTEQPDRWFLQGLIHFAVGFYHHQNSNVVGATRQLRKGLKKIQGYLPEWDGVNTAAIEREARRCLEVIEAGGRVEEFPKIEQVRPYPGPRTGWTQAAGQWASLGPLRLRGATKVAPGAREGHGWLWSRLQAAFARSAL